MDNKKDIKKHDWGYELIWNSSKTHGGKLLVFEKPGNTNFVFYQSIDKSFFVNTGEFIFSWIDTESGNIYQQKLEEGGVFNVVSLTPFSITCSSNKGSLSECNSGDLDEKEYIVIRKEILQ